MRISKLLFFIFFLFFSPRNIYGSFERLDVSARASALGGAFAAFANSSFGGFYNPAALGALAWREAGFFYTRPYGLQELSYFSFAFADPYLLSPSAATLSISIMQYGFELYNEKSLKASYANSFEKIFFFGLSLGHYHLSIKNYGSESATGIDVGTLLLLSPEVSLGFSAFNLNQPKLGDEALPTSYIFAVAYAPEENLRLLLDIEKDPRFALMVKSGVEYEPAPAISLRAGFSTNPSKVGGGIGIHHGWLDIDYALTQHPDLGLTHQAALHLHFGVANGQNAFQQKVLALNAAYTQSATLSEESAIDLNQASATDLLRVPGITQRVAFHILRYREEYGSFLSLEELLNVRGINQELYEKISPYLIIE